PHNRTEESVMSELQRSREALRQQMAAQLPRELDFFRRHKAEWLAEHQLFNHQLCQQCCRRDAVRHSYQGRVSRELDLRENRPISSAGKINNETIPTNRRSQIVSLRCSFLKTIAFLTSGSRCAQ
ncbi:MAG TPA: hypothetical protein VFR84_04530, partial [Candidatus Angelobacter sp.]|nr:hypothetical protein [Candidatus Angelobacter sp.]